MPVPFIVKLPVQCDSDRIGSFHLWCPEFISFPGTLTCHTFIRRTKERIPYRALLCKERDVGRALFSCWPMGFSKKCSIREQEVEQVSPLKPYIYIMYFKMIPVKVGLLLNNNRAGGPHFMTIMEFVILVVNHDHAQLYNFFFFFGSGSKHCDC